MSTFLTPAMISKEAYCRFENNLVIARSISWTHSDKFAKSEAQIGSDYTVRRRIHKITRLNDPAWSASNGQVLETAVKLVIDREFNVNMSITDAELTLKVEDFGKRVIGPVIVSMASKADSEIASMICNCAGGGATLVTGGIGNPAVAAVATGASYAVGAYGTAITPSLVTYAHKVLQDLAMPDDGEIYGVLSTSHNRQLVLAQASLFNPLMNVDGEYKKGLIGTFDGIEFSMSQSLVRHTNGAQPTLVVSAGNATTGWTETATLTVTALAGAINPGDVFQSSTVFLVNPLTKVVTDTPAQFTVVASAAIGDTAVTVYPAPISAGDYQNISATLNGVTLQLTGAVLPEVTVVGSAAVTLGGVESFIFHKTAIEAASPELVMPKQGGVEMATQIKDPDADGFKFRMIRAWDNFGVSTTGGFGTGRAGSGTRIDAFAGFKVVAPFIVRVRG